LDLCDKPIEVCGGSETHGHTAIDDKFTRESRRFLTITETFALQST